MYEVGFSETKCADKFNAVGIFAICLIIVEKLFMILYNRAIQET